MVFQKNPLRDAAKGGEQMKWQDAVKNALLRIY